MGGWAWASGTSECLEVLRLSINMANPINLNQFKGAFKALADLPYPNIVQAQAPPTHHASNWFTSTVHQPHHPVHHGMHHGRRLFVSWNQLQKMNPFGHSDAALCLLCLKVACRPWTCPPSARPIPPWMAPAPTWSPANSPGGALGA